ncbi:VTT domain-containing protein [Dyella tabacisoli]|uniref:Sulfurtransferase n=1 Tax=Dyella tabacisoli TaxID=2282381 RepID=A0A369URD0_9GAMM|nr:VTT domain-containing protein [Dyella tabacisoli]RDD82853.1 sulfurtransferase [Dyella tabacisoli]
MAHEIIALIAQYGLVLVFFNVLLEQAGLPMPAVPTLIVAGALAANGQLSVVGILITALVACLLGDLAWYLAGRRFGGGVMRTLCRISLSPDSCVKQSELRFQRWRGQVLLFAKFVPGLSTVAPPLVGAMGLSAVAFVWLDGLGSLMWAGLAVGLGYAFAAQIDQLLAILASAGTLAIELLAVLLVLYIAARWWQRQRLLRSIRMARITVEELYRAMEMGQAPIVVDVRPPASRLIDGRVISGALLVDVAGVGGTMYGISFERELVTYCNCPNEVSAAIAAKALVALGYRRVRPLLGGLDAWEAAGYPIEQPEPTDAVLAQE